MKKTKLLIISIALINSFICISQESFLKLSIPFGSYSVGFKAIDTYDYSRSFSANTDDKRINKEESTFRPMQISIWYPAKNNVTKAKMKYEDYFFLRANETGAVNLTKELKEKIITEFVETEPVSIDRFYKELKVNMSAIKDAKGAIGEFPVIIYGPSWWATSYENALMFELLASHGYIVISSPSMGPDTREMPITRIGIETQARDMEFLISKVRDFPNADINKLSLMGYSLGGLSDVLTMARNKSIDAWIGLDPTIHEEYGIFEKSPYEDYSLFNVPTLFIQSLGFIGTTPFYDKLIYSDAFMVNLPKLQHTNFASQFIKLLEIDKNESKNVIKGYNLICKYVLSFLDGLYKEGFNYDEMKKEVFNLNKIDTSFVQIQTKKALPNPNELFNRFKDKNSKPLLTYLNDIKESNSYTLYPERDIHKLIFLFSNAGLEGSANKLMEWYGSNYNNSFPNKVLNFIDFKVMVNMFVEIYKNNSNQCNFSIDQLNHTGHMLSMGSRGQEAIKYFDLNVKLNPNNSYTYFNLGVGYFRIKDNQNAKKYFNLCIDSNPEKGFLNLAKDFLNKME